MNKALAEMFHYNAWANWVLFEACRSLADEHLDNHIQGTSGSIRELLLHIVGAQQTMILRTKGRWVLKRQTLTAGNIRWPEATVRKSDRPSDQ
jgi:uncharacterized damage-inducible protein DinB